MISEKIDIKTKDGICDSFIAYPEDGESYPAVLFYMDGFGPRAYLHSMAEKLASYGYYVLVPNLFYRVRRAPLLDVSFPLKAEDMPEARKKLMALFQNYSVEGSVEDAGIFLEFLAKQKQIRSGKIGVTGYCMGGGLSIRTAARYPDRIAAAASFHGARLATDEPDSPHNLLGQIKCELYIANADNDQSMPPEQIERLRSELDRNHNKYEMETYAGAAHGFTMADLPAYNEGALKRHWEKLSGLLARVLT